MAAARLHVNNGRISVAAGVTMVAHVTLDQVVAECCFAALNDGLDPERTACSLFETAPGRWTIAAYLPDSADAASVREMIGIAAGPKAAEALAFETIGETNWVAASLAALTPVRAGRFFVHGAHDRTRVPANAVGIEIEAALAFGTGHHGTTRGCLLAMDGLMRRMRVRRALDLGTGSGVLAIAAARALRRPALASDIDRRAIITARTNVRFNGAGHHVELVRAAGLAHRRFRERAPFDLILANILLSPLKQMARPIARMTTSRTRVVLSGLLPAQANAALAAYRPQGLVLERRILLDGWITLVLRCGGRHARKNDFAPALAGALSIGARVARNT
jgi:ribosomal protein L11 methyltransferase